MADSVSFLPNTFFTLTDIHEIRYEYYATRDQLTFVLYNPVPSTTNLAAVRWTNSSAK
jgi:uncharacterized membrane protein